MRGMEKKKRGRKPRAGKPSLAELRVRMTDEELAELAAAARSAGTSTSALVRFALRELLALLLK